MEIVAARNHLAKRLKDDVGWWYNQARRLVEAPQGRLDDNATKIILAVFDKLLPSLREISRDEEAKAPPVSITIHGINRGPAVSGASNSPAQTMTVEVTADAGSSQGPE